MQRGREYLIAIEMTNVRVITMLGIRVLFDCPGIEEGLTPYYFLLLRSSPIWSCAKIAIKATTRIITMIVVPVGYLAAPPFEFPR
jgi:hypothetical protein